MISRLSTLEGELLITAVVLLAMTLWCLISFGLATLGSWNDIAQRYPARVPAHGHRFLLESARFGSTPYPSCITVHVSPDGLFLNVIGPLRLGHPPIFIPATAMHHYRTPKTWFVRRSVFDIGWPRICTVQLRRKVVQSIEGFATGSGAPRQPLGSSLP